MSFSTIPTTEDCRICPLVAPACPDCPSGQTCIIIAQSCNTCAYTSCLDNAQVSAGHYTLGSSGVIGPVSTINPGGPIQSTSSGTATTSASLGSTSGATTSASTSSGSISSGTTALTTSSSGSGASTTSSNISGIASGVSSSISSSLATITGSSSSSSGTGTATATTSPGAAALVGVNSIETQGLLWLIIAFWFGMGVFGGRRWRA